MDPQTVSLHVRLERQKLTIKRLTWAVAVATLFLVLAIGGCVTQMNEVESVRARMKDRIQEYSNLLSEERARGDKGYSSWLKAVSPPNLEKTVSVAALINNPDGLAVQIDEDLYKSMVKNELRKNGFVIVERNASALVYININALKIDEFQFAYSFSMSAKSNAFRDSKNHNLSVEIFAKSSVGVVGLSRYQAALKDGIEKYTVQLIDGLNSDIDWKQDEPTAK